MSKKTAQRKNDRIKKYVQKQQQKSRKEAVCDELGFDPNDILSYREYENNTVSVVVPDGHKYWFIVTENLEHGTWDVEGL